MLSSEIIYPIRRALFPNFAILVAEKRRFRETVVLLISFAATMVIAVQFGLAATSADFVAVILGPRWTYVTPLIETLAFAGAATSLLMVAEFLLPVTNRARLAAIVAWSELIVLVPTLIYVSKGGDIIDLAKARLVIAVIFVPIMYVVIARACDLDLRGMIGALWRPLVAGATMFFVVRQAQSLLDVAPFIRLFAGIGVGAVTYVVSIALLWLLSGKPPGMETQLWIRLKQRSAP